MNSIKTLHFTNAWHEKSGGISTFYRALLSAANREHRQVRLVVPGREERREEVGDWGLIYYIRAAMAPLNSDYRVILPHRYLLPNSPILRILREERPDLVEVCDKYTLTYLAGLLRRGWLPGIDFRPSLVGMTCERMDENLGAYLGRGTIADWFCQRYIKWVYFGLFDHHIANSQHTADELRLAARGHIVRRGVWVCPMGADVDRFSAARRTGEGRAALASRFGGRTDSVLLLYAGRLAPEKNLPLLLDTMVRLNDCADRDFRLVVAGDGIGRAALESEFSRRLPGRAAFLGHIAGQEALAQLYANCDVFVHPNPREPFGIAPLEAMAAGLALVAPNEGGVVSYAGPDNAWLAKPTPEDFAAAVRSAASDTAERSRRLEAARTTSARLGWSAVTSHFLRLYAEIHQRRNGESPQPGIQPSFYSTKGDWLGNEVSPA